MLDVDLKKQLADLFVNLVNDVEIIAYLDDSSQASELRELVLELSELSTRITVFERDDARERRPSIALSRRDELPRQRFAGVPMGHEFNSLVLAILHTGGHPVKAEPHLIDHIQQIEGELNFDSYISLSCQNCPEVVQALNLMALLNPNIRSTMIDGSLFPDEISERQVMAVPSVFLNGEVFSQGRISLAEILAKLDGNSAEKEADTMNAKDDFDVLVVGGGPAGASAAIYAARKGIQTGIVAERFGGQVMDTVAIENFISVKATEGPQLVASLEAHVRDYDVDIMSNQRVIGLSTKAANSDDTLVNVELANGASLRSKSVILATGARWREMNVPGELEYRGKGVAYCPHCDGPLFKGKHVAVIGGGNSGVEAAIDLAGIVRHVTLIEFDEQLRADEVLQRKLHRLSNVDIVTHALTTEVLGDGKRVTGLTYHERLSQRLQHLPLDGVFVQIGLIPNSEWLAEVLALNEQGEIIVDAKGQTSLPGVYAAGDATNLPYKQIIISMGSGATAALGAFDHLIRAY